jgi:hypothetical protein
MSTLLVFRVGRVLEPSINSPRAQCGPISPKNELFGQRIDEAPLPSVLARAGVNAYIE